MVATKEIQGICSTCQYVCECHILKRSRAEGRVIWHCEAFDDPDLPTEKDRESKHPVVMYSNNLIPGWDR